MSRMGVSRFRAQGMNFMDIRFYSSRTGLNWRPRQIHQARRGHASARLTGCITKRGTAIAFVNIIVFWLRNLPKKSGNGNGAPFPQTGTNNENVNLDAKPWKTSAQSKTSDDHAIRQEAGILISMRGSYHLVEGLRVQKP